jgi:16S rRNA G966 N2-methylase RsmD
MNTKTWNEIFGNNLTPVEIVKQAMDSNITVADWLHSSYIEMYPDSDEQLDFDKLGEQITDDATADLHRRMADWNFSAAEQEFIFADWPNAEEHIQWLLTATRTEIDNWIDPEAVATIERSHAAAILGSRGGSVTSASKAASSAANGRKGGRPKKVI